MIHACPTLRAFLEPSDPIAVSERSISSPMKWPFCQHFQTVTSPNGFHVVFDEHTQSTQIIGAGSILRVSPSPRTIVVLRFHQAPTAYDFGSCNVNEVAHMERDQTRALFWADVMHVDVASQPGKITCVNADHVSTQYFYDYRADQTVTVLGHVSDFGVVDDALVHLVIPEIDHSSRTHWLSYNIDEITPFAYSKRLTQTFGFYLNDWSLRLDSTYLVPAVAFATGNVDSRKVVALANKDIAFLEQKPTMFVNVPDNTALPLEYTPANAHLTTVLTDRPLTDQVTLRLRANRAARQERQVQIGGDKGFGARPFLETSTPFAPSLRVHPSVCVFGVHLVSLNPPM